MSNQSNKDAFKELFEVNLDKGKHSMRPNGTYTLDDNGDVLRSAPVGHPSGRTVDLNFPSRTTDPRPGISGVQATDPQQRISRVQASAKDFKTSNATSDLKSGPERTTQSGSIFSNRSVFQTSLLRAGSNSVLKQDSAPVVDQISDLSKSSKPKKKANIEPDTPSPPPVDYLSEADHILIDLEEFGRTCETKYRPSISNPRHGSRELIRNSKWLKGQSSKSIKDNLSSDDVDSDFNVDELLAYYHGDTAQANQKTVAAESPVVTANHPQVEHISARPKQKKINRGEMRDPDPVRVHFKVPKRRPKKPKQWEVTGTDHFIDEIEPITTLENYKEKPRTDTPLPSASYVSNSPSALDKFAAMHRTQPSANMAKKKKLKYTYDHVVPTPLPSRPYPSPPTALEEFAARHRAQPPAILANKKKLQYTSDNVIPTLPSRPSPSPPTALDEFAASTQSLPHPLLANKKKLQYTYDNVIPTLPSRPSPSPPTALDEFVASTQSLPHPLLANKKKLQYTYDNVIPMLSSRPSPSPPTALDEFVASTRSLPHPLLANKKKLQYTYDNVIPMLPSRPSPSPPTALDEFVASTRSLPHPLLANKKKLQYTYDNVIPTLPSRSSPSPPTALDEFAASTQSLPHPLLANKKKLQYTYDNVIPMLPSRPSPSPPTALDEFVASTRSLPHPLLANKKKLQYTYDNVIPTLPSRSSPSPPTALDEFVASTRSLPHPLLANMKKLQYTYDTVIPTLPSRPSPSPPTALDEIVTSTRSLPHPLLANQRKLQYTHDNVILTLPSRPSPSPPTALDEFAAKFPAQSPPHNNTILSTNSSQSSTSLNEVAEIHSNRPHLFMKLPRFTAIFSKKDARSKPPKQTKSLPPLKKTQKKKKSKTGETSTLRDDDRRTVTQTVRNAQSLHCHRPSHSQPLWCYRDTLLARFTAIVPPL